MTWWKVKTLDKKSVEEHEFWQKDDMVIRRITGFRWVFGMLRQKEMNLLNLNE